MKRSLTFLILLFALLPAMACDDTTEKNTNDLVELVDDDTGRTDTNEDTNPEESHDSDLGDLGDGADDLSEVLQDIPEDHELSKDLSDPDTSDLDHEEDLSPTGREAMFALIDEMEACVNIGNWAEAPNFDWGVSCDESDFARLEEGGFDTIRLPVRWESRSLDTSPYTIDEAFFAQIDQVLEWCATYHLKVVLDMHHHEDFYDNPTERREQFLAMWEQIATRYQDHKDDFLIFEIMNEPHGNLDAETWNLMLAQGLDVIRETNPTRPVVITAAEWGGLAAIEKLVLPDDPYLIFTFHYYSPFQFTHQGASWVNGADAWLGTTWGGTVLDRLALRGDMEVAESWALAQNIPIFLGEFGAYRTAPMEDRARWTEAVARFSEDAGMAWCYWEYKAGFGLWSPSNQSWNTPLTDALFSQDTSILDINMGDLGESLLTNGDFEQGLDGWRQSFQIDGTSAEVIDGVLHVQVTQAANEDWRIQMIQDLPPLSANTPYAVVFEAWSDTPRPIGVAVQEQGGDWTAFGGSSFQLETSPSTHVLTFDLSQDESNAGLSFNLGGAASTVRIDNVALVLNQ